MAGESERDGRSIEEADAFERQAVRYDAWYDGELGAAAFREEILALGPLLGGLPRPWLEIGVGSGRFARELRVDVGIDPAQAPLILASGREVRVTAAQGEALPFRRASFGAVLLVTSLCFVSDPGQVLREARRVLADQGRLVLGLIPGEGPWGREYRALAAQGNPYYRRAHFFDRAEIGSLFATAGLRPVRTRSALFWPPAGEPVPADPREGDDPSAGFIAVMAQPF